MLKNSLFYMINYFNKKSAYSYLSGNIVARINRHTDKSKAYLYMISCMFM